MPKTYTSVPSVSTGDVYAASAYNTYTAQNLNNLIVPPMCRVYRGAFQSINNATDTFVTFPSEDIDTDGMFAPTSDTITIQTAGVYMVSSGVAFGSNATGVRALNIFKNASTIDITKGIASHYGPPANGLVTYLVCSTITECAVSDTIKVAAYQTSGGALNIGVTDNTRATFLSVAWLGRTS